MRKLFGTDGVRGLVGSELTAELATALARGAALLASDRVARPRLLVGRDTRASCDLFEAAVAAGLCSVGADAVLGGVMPTPALAYLVRALSLDGGIMISASHNSQQYNGLKFFGPAGNKLSDSQEAAIEMLANERPAMQHTRAVGRAEPKGGLLRAYHSLLVSHASGGLRGLRVVVDCGHGALSDLAPLVLAELGADVIALNCAPNGTNINQGGAVQPDQAAHAVREHAADAGLAFDGDGDRIAIADETGALMDGDQMLAIWARDLSARGQLAGSLVVGTVITNGGLEEFLRSMGCRLVRTPVGDRHVAAEMGRLGAVLGGESCGHMIFLPHLSSSDGLSAAIAIMRILATAGRPLSSLASAMRRRPQVSVSVPADGCSDRQWGPAALRAIAEANEALRDRGWVVIRPSGTEPVVRITCECDDPDRARAIAQQLAAVLQQGIGGQEGRGDLAV